MELGEILRRYRKDNGFSQTEIARKCSISQKEYSKIESNKSLRTFRIINIICRSCSKSLLDIAKEMLDEPTLSKSKRDFLIKFIESLI